MRPRSTLALVATFAITAVSAHAASNVISWAYANGLAIPVDGAAGVVSVTNWNLTQEAGTSDLKYSDGTSSLTTISLSGGFGAWGIGGVGGADGNGTYNKALFDGYYNSLGSTLTLGDIPFAEYDVYVYFSSDGDNRTGTVSDGTTTFSFSTIMRNQIDNDPSVTFFQTTDTGSGNPGANYAVFSGLSGASKTFTIANTSDGMGFAGIQIVAVPEPSAALLGAFGILGLLRRRR